MKLGLNNMGLDDRRFLISLITLVPESILQKKVSQFAQNPIILSISSCQLDKRNTLFLSSFPPSEDQLWNIQPLTIWHAFLGWESEKWFERSCISASEPHLQMPNASLN